MWLYLLLFLMPALAYKLSSNDQSKAFLMVYVAFLALFVGMSDMFGGYDRYIYGEVFDSIADTTTMGGGLWSCFCHILPERARLRALEHRVVVVHGKPLRLHPPDYTYNLHLPLPIAAALLRQLSIRRDAFPWPLVLFIVHLSSSGAWGHGGMAGHSLHIKAATAEVPHSVVHSLQDSQVGIAVPPFVFHTDKEIFPYDHSLCHVRSPHPWHLTIAQRPVHRLWRCQQHDREKRAIQRLGRLPRGVFP